MKNAWKSFLSLCQKTKTPDELSRLLACFLTVEEKKSISDRYAIIAALLDAQLSQRDISEKLNVSIAKITRGSNALKIVDPALKSFLEKHII